LYLLKVPFALFWGALGASLRFIPYIGPIAAAGGPIVLSMAALPGWAGPLEVAAFYSVLELFTNLVLETVLYAGAAGVSQVALLVAVAFWTWLWGPLGLVLATPLTVCAAVMGKHLPGLEILTVMMSDVPALTIGASFYQRLLAGDQAEAAELIDRFVKTNSPDEVYDELLIPALNSAERDRVEGRLSAAEESTVTATTDDLLEILTDPRLAPPPSSSLRVFGYGINGAADQLALRMLDQLLTDAPVTLEIGSVRLLASELVSHIRSEGYPVVCLGDLPPSPYSRTRLLVKRLQAALPDVRIAVGRWASPAFADETTQPLLDAGASHVAHSLLETRKYLAEAALVPAPLVPARNTDAA
jgi:AI-2E family transporter/B12 binding domain